MPLSIRTDIETSIFYGYTYVCMYFRQRMNEHFQLLFAGFCEPLVRGSKGYRVPAYNVQCLPTLCLHVDDADLSDIT